MSRFGATSVDVMVIGIKLNFYSVYASVTESNAMIIC